MSQRPWLGCRPKHDLDGEDQLVLKMAADTQLLLAHVELQYLDHGHTICMTFMPGNQFFDVVHHYHERRVLFLSEAFFFFCPKALLPHLKLHGG